MADVNIRHTFRDGALLDSHWTAVDEPVCTNINSTPATVDYSYVIVLL